MLAHRVRLLALAASVGFVLGLLLFQDVVVASIDALLFSGVVWLKTSG